MRPPDPDRLAELLPAIYRVRDAEVDGPLQALLGVVTQQVDVVEADLEQLSANWFIETCEDWVVPYLGDLIGYTPGPGAAAMEAPTAVRIPRTDVAGTISARRRKGTLALLEELARDVAGWFARAVEFAALVAASQALDHLRLERGRTVDLHQGDPLQRLGGAFDNLARTVSVGRSNSTRTRSLHNLPSVALFAWRLKPYPVTRAPAFCTDRVRHHYTFSILGNDTPLITRPVEEPAPTHIADELNVPAFIRRRAFDERTADYYGPRNRSLHIWRDGLDRPVPLSQIVPADLTDWTYRPQRDQVAVDPVLGRIAFSPRNAPDSGVWVTYHHGFSDDLGGGEYPRPPSPVAGRNRYRVGPDQDDQAIMAAVARWRADQAAGRAGPDAVIEITDSGAYQEPMEIVLAAGERLELRAAQATRPVIRLLDWYSNRPDSLRVRGITADEVATGVRPPRLVLDGLLVTGRGVQVIERVAKVTIRHCTLVPGWSLGPDCEPEHGEETSVELTDTSTRLVVERSVLGSIRVDEDEVATEPIQVSISDSILDATSGDDEALDGPDDRHAHAVLRIARSTVVGRVLVHAIDLAEDSIFLHPVRVARRQIGCMRFCSVEADGSRTPRRFNCQPDLAVAAVRAEPGLDAGERAAAEALERERVRPRFASLRYGTPAYGRLADGCAREILEGAHDESEMGVFHDLFEPQRAANLLARLDEHTPAGMDAGVVFAT